MTNDINGGYYFKVDPYSDLIISEQDVNYVNLFGTSKRARINNCAAHVQNGQVIFATSFKKADMVLVDGKAVGSSGLKNLSAIASLCMKLENASSYEPKFHQSFYQEYGGSYVLIKREKLAPAIGGTRELSIQVIKK